MRTLPPSTSISSAVTELLTVPPISGTALATQQALDRRDELVLSAATVTIVTDPATAEQAATVLKELKAFQRQVEASREDVKRPVIVIGKAIEALAAELTTAVDEQSRRVSRLLGDYQNEVRRQQEKTAREAREEEQRIRDEADTKAQAAIDSGRSVDKKLEKIETQTFAQIATVRSVAVTPVAPKIAGVATRNEVKFEVTDIDELHRSRPELVTLTPNTAAIKAVLKASPKIQLPGIRHWTEAQTIVR